MEKSILIRKCKGHFAAFSIMLEVFSLWFSSTAKAQAPELALRISKISTGLILFWSLRKVSALSQRRTTTHSPFFTETKTFSDPFFADLLVASLGAEPKESTPRNLVALNNHSVQTTFGKFKHTDAIVAARKNDLPMSIKDRRPFWIIFPLAKKPDLETEDFYRFMIWQLGNIITGRPQ
jgi:hypothetical protein